LLVCDIPRLILDHSTDIFVPPEQVIDTVDLYFLRNRHRRLSLRFLSWFVLGENIQTETHESIEDARSALKLYKAYHAFEERGVFDDEVEELYRVGQQHVRDVLLNRVLAARVLTAWTELETTTAADVVVVVVVHYDGSRPRPRPTDLALVAVHAVHPACRSSTCSPR
jgi:hypothetical protein